MFVLKKEDAAFLETLAGKFTSKNKNPRGYGNQEHSEEVLIALVNEVLKSHPNVSEDIKALFVEEDVAYENLCNYILSDPVDYDYGFCRVISTVTVTEIEKGSILKKKGSLGELVFVNLLPDNIVLCRQAQHVMIDGVPDINMIEWTKITVDLNKLDTAIIEPPTTVSKIVADLI